MKKSILLALISAVLLAVIVWWVRSGEDSQPLSRSLNDSTPSASVRVPEPPIDPEPSHAGVVSTESQSASTAKRIVHVPSVDPKSRINYEDILELTPENLSEFSSHNLQLALSGDVYAVPRLLEVLRKCRDTPKTNDEIEKSVEKELRVFEIRRENEVNAPDYVYQSERDIRTRLQSLRKACLQSEDVFNDKLRIRLEKLSEQGHVVARYLYATWPPDYSKNIDEFQLQQEWTLKAKEYSLLNYEEGEVAGLLAFAQSYGSGKLFTQNALFLGHAFYIAAYDCGFVDIITQWIKDTYSSSGQLPWGDLNRQAEVLVLAEKLVMNCR